MKNKIIIILIFAILLFSFGCLKKGNMKYCCDPIALEKDPTWCVFADGSTPLKIHGSCDMDKLICEVEIEDTDSDGNPIIKIENRSICSTMAPKTDCNDENCTLMLCGQFNYQPGVFGGGTSTNPPGEDELSDKAKEKTSEPADYPGLYDGWCMFVPFNYQVSNVFEKAEGEIYVNTFRFGVGNTFMEYERYKLYFPITDSICG
ncbi:MAG: hypothetical protein PHU63_01710, partial [Candidatus ainarchaeum sp.]|nr:hypothetical protein [Candidatus ainarchaeum sp.]